MDRRAGVILVLAVCAFWTFGETLSCDQCGRECVNSCGTRQFRACCFNNLKKRVPNPRVKFSWVDPTSHAEDTRIVYDDA